METNEQITNSLLILLEKFKDEAVLDYRKNFDKIQNTEIKDLIITGFIQGIDATIKFILDRANEEAPVKKETYEENI